MASLFGPKCEPNSPQAKKHLIKVTTLIDDNDPEGVTKALKKHKFLFDTYDEFDRSPLVYAVREGSLDCVNAVLDAYQKAKANINVPDKNGFTALHHIVYTDVDPKKLLAVLNTPDIQVNVINNDHTTPLHYFCQKYLHKDMSPFELMVTKGVNTNAVNKNNESPLHKAVLNQSIADLMVTTLLKHGANINELTTKGESALTWAVRLGREDLVITLLENGADKDITCSGKGASTITLIELAESMNFPTIGAILQGGTRRSDTLMAILQNPTLRENFRAFLQTELSEENITFWTEIEAFRVLKISSLEELIPTAQKIYDKYFIGSSEVNLPYKTKNRVKKAMESKEITQSMFDEAQHDVYDMMNKDSYTRYVKFLKK